MRTVRRIVSLISFIAGLGLLTWASIPSRRQVLDPFIPQAEMQAPSSRAAAVPPGQIVRQVKLEWPSSMRIGDKESITMLIIPLTQIMSPDPGSQHSNVYDRYNLMVEGRFEVAGLLVSPANPVRESLLSGQPLTLKWQVMTNSVGSYPGNVWLSLRYLPLDGSEASQVPIFVREVDIRVTSLVGLGGPQARVVGGAGIIVGMGLGYDVIIGIIKKLTTKDTKDTKDLKEIKDIKDTRETKEI